jgi:hypothetical protein
MYILKTRYLLLICTLLYLVGVQAQNPEKKQLPREVPSPERVATKMTDEMKRDLQLSEKQYDKIYDLNLKEQKIVFENVLSHPALGNEERPQMGEHPNFGGEHEHSRENGGGEIGHGMRRNHFNSSENFGHHSMSQESAERLKKVVESNEKKFKKILTKEQYAKWEEIKKTKHPANPEPVIVNPNNNL